MLIFEKCIIQFRSVLPISDLIKLWRRFGDSAKRALNSDFPASQRGTGGVRASAQRLTGADQWAVALPLSYKQPDKRTTECSACVVNEKASEPAVGALCALVRVSCVYLVCC